MNVDPENSEAMRCSLIRNPINLAKAHWNPGAFFVVVQIAAQSSRAVAILAALAVFSWFLPSAQAVDPPLTNASSTAPIGVAKSNANVRSPQTSTSTGKLGGSTNGAAEAALVAKTVPINSMDTLDDKHKLAIGDRLSFRIVEDEDDPKEIFVTVSGDVEVPYLGRYPVVGETCKEIAWKLKAELEKKYYYHATVILAVNDWARNQGKVYIMGPVHAPGPLEIPSDEVLTLNKAIMRAGGFGDYAERHKVEVRRKSAVPGEKDQVFIVDVALIQDKGKTDSDLPLEAGDVIYVPERLVRF
jgi:protein involved in polysaccharide export with SLBB domain